MAADLTATLGSVTFTVMPDPDWGQVTREAAEAANIYADADTQLTVSTSKLRRMTFRAKLTGTTKDDLIAKEAALRAEMRKATNTFTLAPRSATNTVTFRVLSCPVPLSPFDYAYDHLYTAITTIVLICEPWAYSPEVTLYSSSAQTSPALVSLGDLSGEGDPTLELTVTRDWTGATVGIQTVVVALATGGTSISDYFYEAESGDMTGSWDSDDTVLNPSAGAAAKLPSATTTAWTALNDVVDPATLPEGRYRVMVRAKTSSSDGDNFIAMCKATSTARDAGTRRELDTFWEWHDLGDWVNFGGSELVLYGKSATYSLWIDCVLMVPVDWGYVRYDDDDELTDNWTMGWLYGHTYGTCAAPTTQANAAARMVGHGLKAPLEDFDLLILVEPNGSDPDPAFTLDGSYYPRWEMFR